MSWYDAEVELDAGTARRIALDMRAVALADGDVHPQELELIEGFEGALPDGSEAVQTIDEPELVQVYLRSLVMVALADGRVSEVELAVIRDLATLQGASPEQLDQAVQAVKEHFLEAFSGVTIFKAAVDLIAQELGLEG